MFFLEFLQIFRHFVRNNMAMIKGHQHRGLFSSSLINEAWIEWFIYKKFGQYDDRFNKQPYSDHSTASSGDSLFNVTAADALPLVPSSLEERNSHSQHVSTQTNVNIIQDVQSGNKERAQTLQVFLHIIKSYI